MEQDSDSRKTWLIRGFEVFFLLVFGCFRMKAHLLLQNGRNLSLSPGPRVWHLGENIWSIYITHKYTHTSILHSDNIHTHAHTPLKLSQWHIYIKVMLQTYTSKLILHYKLHASIPSLNSNRIDWIIGLEPKTQVTFLALLPNGHVTFQFILFFWDSVNLPEQLESWARLGMSPQIPALMGWYRLLSLLCWKVSEALSKFSKQDNYSRLAMFAMAGKYSSAKCLSLLNSSTTTYHDPLGALSSYHTVAELTLAELNAP